MHTRRFGQLAARTFLAAALVAGVAACGDDDDDAAVDAPADDGEQAAGSANEDFCTGLAEFNSAVTATDLGDESSEEDVKAVGETLTPLWTTLRANTPDDVKDEMEELNSVIGDLGEGDAEAFNDDATFETYGRLLEEGIPTCDFESVSVRGVDYAFEGVPETMTAGTVAVEFENASEEEEHEMVVFKKNDPSQSTEELFAMPEEEAMGLITFAGFAFATPGGTSSTLLNLESGSYTMVCFIPVGGEDDGPPHFTQGMTTEFTVE